jgi:hypothetical protein
VCFVDERRDEIEVELKALGQELTRTRQRLRREKKRSITLTRELAVLQSKVVLADNIVHQHSAVTINRPLAAAQRAFALRMEGNNHFKIIIGNLAIARSTLEAAALGRDRATALASFQAALAKARNALLGQVGVPQTALLLQEPGSIFQLPPSPAIEAQLTASKEELLRQAAECAAFEALSQVAKATLTTGLRQSKATGATIHNIGQCPYPFFCASETPAASSTECGSSSRETSTFQGELDVHQTNHKTLVPQAQASRARGSRSKRARTS